MESHFPQNIQYVDPASDVYADIFDSKVIDLFAPSTSTVNAVRDWLIDSGVPAKSICQSVNKGWLQFDCTTAELESLLQTKYYMYENVATGRTSLATDEYYVPAKIQEHIDYITPGIKLLATDQARKKGPMVKPVGPQPFAPAVGGAPSCGTRITPQCVKTLYNVTTPTLANKGNSMGIYESGDTYAQADLDQFFAAYAR